MSKLKSVILTGTTDGSGNQTVTDTKASYGFLYAVELIDGSADDGIDFTLETINNPISGVTKPLLVIADFNTDQTQYPRTLIHSDTTGAALTGTAGGDRAMLVVDGTLQVRIAQGGAAKTFGCIVYLLGND